jgi:hypothetical protein
MPIDLLSCVFGRQKEGPDAGILPDMKNAAVVAQLREMEDPWQAANDETTLACRKEAKANEHERGYVSSLLLVSPRDKPEHRRRRIPSGRRRRRGTCTSGH